MNVWILVRLYLTKVSEQCKLCYKDTDSFIIYIKTQDVYAEIAVDVEK